MIKYNELLELSDLLNKSVAILIHELRDDPQPTPLEPPDGIALAFGTHVVTINSKVTKVYVSLVDDNAGTCGGADVSTVGVSILDDSFILYVNIKSDSAVLKWVVL